MRNVDKVDEKVIASYILSLQSLLDQKRDDLQLQLSYLSDIRNGIIRVNMIPNDEVDEATMRREKFVESVVCACKGKIDALEYSIGLLSEQIAKK